MPDKKKLTELTDPSVLEGEEVDSPSPLSDAISGKESGGEYNITNPNSSATGKYQFLWSVHHNDITKVTGIRSQRQFLRNPQAQEDYYKWHEEHNLMPAVSRIRQYNKDGYDDQQIARLVHFKGEEGATEWLTNHVDNTKDNNIPISQYIGKPKGGSKLHEITDGDLLSGEEVPLDNANNSQPTGGASQTNYLAPIKPTAAESAGIPQIDPITGMPVITNPQQPSSPDNAAGQAAQPEWNAPHATIDNAPAQGITVGVTGKADMKFKPKPTKQEGPLTDEDVKAQTASSSKYLADDIIDNVKDLPAEYSKNITNVPFTQPGNIIHDITDVHGDPTITAGYMRSRLAQLTKDHADARQQAMSSMRNDAHPDMDQLGKIESDFFTKQNQLKESATHIIDMQLANKAQGDKNYDPISLGIQKLKLLGDKRAEQDEIAYNNKRALDPQAKFAYQSVGYDIMQKAKQNTAANGQQAVADQFGQHSDNAQQRLEKDNPEIFKQERIRNIGNIWYQKQNSLHHAIFSASVPTQKELEDLAKEAGYTPSQLKDIKPEDIPTYAGVANEAVQGLFNTAGAPLYEGGMRALAALGIADKSAVNERFHPGWEDDNTFGHLFTGKTPEGQNQLSMSNPRAIASAMGKGVGDLFGFLANAEGGSSLLTATGLTKDAIKAQQISNFVTAAIPSYNSAAEKAMTVIGDAPEDESKRQLYSIVNGIIGGAVMMIDPKADVARDILGETKSGRDIIKMLKSKDLGELTRSELKDKITRVLSETTQHIGLQAAIPAIQTAAGNITDMIMDPTHEHGVTDNVQHAAMSGAVAMFLPSLFSGLRAPGNQTRMNKSLMWEVGSNTRKYREDLTALYKEGKLSKDEMFTAIDNVNKVGGIIKNQLPISSITGKELTGDQKQDYAWSLLKTDDLNNQLDKIEGTKDKAQVDEIRSMIGNEDKLRADILAKAGESVKVDKPILQPTTELGLSQRTNMPEEKSARQIAREVVNEVVKENSEKNNEDSKENVSLIPEDNSSKTYNNEEADNHERQGQDSSEIGKTTGSEEGSEVRRTTSGELSREEEDRLLADKESEQSSSEGGPQPSQQQGESPAEGVLVQKKRRFVNEEETPAPASTKAATSPIEVEPVISERQQSHTKGVFKDEEGTLYKSTESKDGPTKEHEVLSELQDLDNVVRVGPKTETSQGEAFPVEEIVPLKGNDKISLKEAKEVVGTLETMDDRGIYSGEIEMGRDADGKVKIFDLSTAEKRDDTLSDDNYSTVSNNVSRIKERLSEKDAETLGEELSAKKDAETKALLSDENTSSESPQEKQKVKPKRKIKPKETEYQRRKKQANSSDPASFKEAVLQMIVSGERMSYADIQHDLGYKGNDMKAYIRRLSSKGTSVDHFIEQYLHSDAEGTGGLSHLVHDAIDARREFMDIWQDYAHDENKAMDELERIQGKDYKNWEEERYSAHTVGAEMVGADQHDIDSFLEHGNFEAQRTADQQIRNSELSDSDSDNIISYFSSHVKDGVVDGDTAFNTTTPEFAEMYKNLSSAGKKLIDNLLAEHETQGWAELSPEERDSFNKLQTEAHELSKQQTANIIEATSQDSTGEGTSSRSNREQVNENRGAQKPTEVKERSIKDIDLELQIQRQSQKIEAQKRTVAEKARDIPAANKANDNWFKKQARIDRLEEERAALEKKEKDSEREDSIKKTFNKAADWIESTYARNKKSHQGIATSNIFGLSHKLTEPIADFIVARVAEGVRDLGNLAVSVDRAIRLAKEKFGDEAKLLSSEQDAGKITHSIGIDAPPQERAPVLSLANEEAAKDILADVRAGMTYNEAVREILQDGDLNDKTKSKLLNYLDWHLKDQEIHNTQTLRQPDYGNKYIGDYSLTGSGETSTYLSGKTLSDVHGKDVQFDLESKETQLQKNIVQDTANMIGLAKKHTGSDDPLVFGADMLHQLNRIPDGGENSVKKVLAISGLNNELHGERIRLENELQNPTQGDGFIVQDSNEIQKRLRDLNKLIGQVEVKYRDITSNASDVLNAARANRIFRNTYFHDLYADKILSEQQQQAKQKTEEALVKTEVDDAIAEAGPIRPADISEKSVEHIVKDREQSQAGKDVANDITGKKDNRRPKEIKKDKTKGFVNRMKERFGGKEKTNKEGIEETRKEILNKDSATKKAEEYLNGSTPEDLFKKAKEQTKKPC